MEHVDFSYFERQIVDQLKDYLNHSGVFYRIFSRSKSTVRIR